MYTKRIDWKKRHQENFLKFKHATSKRSNVSQQHLQSNKIKESRLTMYNSVIEKYLIFNNDGNFYLSSRSVFLFAQFFGILPVHGLSNDDVNSLEFSWYNFRTIYSIITSLIMFFHNGLILYWIYETSLTFDKTGALVFHYSVLIVTIKFIFLAKNWPELMKKWINIETQLPSSIMQKRSIVSKQIKLVSFITGAFLLIEHLLSVLSALHFALYCNTDPNEVTTKKFFVNHLHYIFFTFEYSLWMAIFGEILNLMFTFIWSYMDIFIIIISVGLIDQFRQINLHLKQMKYKAIAEPTWEFYRIFYRRVCNLCENVDNEISLIIMISFCNNLHTICSQLLRTFNAVPSIIHGVYFWFSLVFLIGRTLAVSLYLAQINEESKKPIEIFRVIPRDSWCKTVNRFSDEVNNDTIALSGMRFFHVTRGLVLTVAGTIVTYELILIQFHQPESYVNCKSV